MEIKILEETKNRIRFEIAGEDHTLCNALRAELWNDKNIEIAGYNIDHPLVSEPEMIVETKGKEDPKKALFAAVARLKKRNKELSVEFKNLK